MQVLCTAWKHPHNFHTFSAIIAIKRMEHEWFPLKMLCILYLFIYFSVYLMSHRTGKITQLQRSSISNIQSPTEKWAEKHFLSIWLLNYFQRSVKMMATAMCILSSCFGTWSLINSFEALISMFSFCSNQQFFFKQ